MSQESQKSQSSGTQPGSVPPEATGMPDDTVSPGEPSLPDDTPLTDDASLIDDTPTEVPVRVVREASQRQQEDRLFVQRARAGDQAAFFELVKRHKHGVERLIRPMVRSASSDELDDLVQEALTKALLHLNSYSEEYAFSTWLYRIATNHAIDYLRRKKLNAFSISAPPSMSTHRSEDESREFEISDDSWVPDDVMLADERTSLIEAAIAQLPENYRRIIRLSLAMLSRLTPRDRRMVWLMAAVGALSRVALVFREPALLVKPPYIEDAFYVFSCARHLAMGQGFTVDGVHPTNGVQPLICLLYAPFFWLTSDRWTGLALTYLLHAVLQIAGTILVAEVISRIQRDDAHSRFSPPIIGAVIWTFSQQLLIHNTSGLETGLVAVLLLWSVLLLGTALTVPRAVGLGVICGLLILARIDTAVYVAILCIWVLVKNREAWGMPVLVGAIAALLSAPWFIYSFQTFGSIMPISGQSEQSHAFHMSTILNSVWEAAVALADIVSVAFYHQLSAVPQWVNVIWVIAIATLFLLCVRRVGPRLTRTTQAILTPLAIFGLFVTVYYTFFFGAPHFLARYLQPVRVLWMIEASLLMPVLIERVRAASGALKAIAMLAVIAALFFSVERYIHNFTTTSVSELYTAGRWAERHAPLLVGMEQSGTAGFIADNVINLDGKVNADALRSRQRGEIGAYLRAMDVRYLLDWPDLIAPTLASARAAGLHFDPIDSIGHVTVYERH